MKSCSTFVSDSRLYDAVYELGSCVGEEEDDEVERAESRAGEDDMLERVEWIERETSVREMIAVELAFVSAACILDL